MLTLRMLGGIGLSGDDATELDALLRLPKRVAVLAYLALPRPGTWHRRGTLLSMFWPDIEQARARTTLRSTLHTLRRHLPPGAVRNRGDDEVSIDPAVVTTDVARMMDAMTAGDYAAVVAFHAGELLPSVDVGESEQFEKWLAAERRRVRHLAVKAAGRLADDRERAGDVGGAVDAARRAAELEPDDEVLARRWIALLDRAGDRAGAFAAYERFRIHMAAEFGTAPSAETIALVDTVRLRRSATAPPREVAPDVGDAPGDAAGVFDRGPSPIEAAVAASASDSRTAVPLRSARAPRRWPALVVAATAIAIAGIAVVSGWRPAVGESPTTRALIVLPMENLTGDSTQDYLGAGIADGVARRLEGIGGITVRSGARAERSETTRHDYEAIARGFGATVLLRSALVAVGDSLEVRASVIDAATSAEKRIAARRFTVAGIRNVESELTAAIAGALFRVAAPSVPRPLNRPVDPESYRLTLEGWHRLLTMRDDAGAKELFQRATMIDPGNARAWSGLSSTWASQVNREVVPFDDGYDRVTGAADRALAIDSLEGTAWANLAFVRALRYRSLSVGLELIGKAVAAEPSNPEIFLIQSSLYRHAHRWDDARDAIRIAHELDPLTPLYFEKLASVELCANRPAIALQLFERELGLNPSDPAARAGLARALARVGRFDEAVALMRTEATREAAAGGGAKAYWELRHREGQRRLQRVRGEAARGWVSPLTIMRAEFAAGEIDAAYKALEAGARDGAPSLFRLLPCGPDLDEVRGTERFEAIANRVGRLPEA